MKLAGHTKSQVNGVKYLIATLLVALAGTASAQDDPARRLSIELNTLIPQDNACRMVFLVENQMGVDLQSVVFETVLFRIDGSVDRLTLFDFKALLQGRPRVRQFDIPDTQCDKIGQVLINEAHVCKSVGATDIDCIGGLKLSTRTKVGVLG